MADKNVNGQPVAEGTEFRLVPSSAARIRSSVLSAGSSRQGHRLCSRQLGGSSGSRP